VWDFARLPAHHQAVVEWAMIAVMTGRLLASDDPREYLAGPHDSFQNALRSGGSRSPRCTGQKRLPCAF